MPLIKSRSKKAFDHNVKAEMDAGKPQDQSLSIAYDVSRRNKKRMAKGGMVNPSLEQAYKSPKDEALEMHREQEAAEYEAHADDRDMEFQDRPDRELHDEVKAARSRASVDSDDHMEMDMRKSPLDLHREYRQERSHADDHDMEFQRHPSMDMHREDKAARGMAYADDEADMGEDMVGKIMRKRYAKGGMASKDSVDLAAEEAEHANAYYPINEHEVVGKEWDSKVRRHSDEDSHGMDEDHHSPRDMDMDHSDIQEDTFDHISRIIEKMHRRKR